MNEICGIDSLILIKSMLQGSYALSRVKKSGKKFFWFVTMGKEINFPDLTF